MAHSAPQPPAVGGPHPHFPSLEKVYYLYDSYNVRSECRTVRVNAPKITRSTSDGVFMLTPLVGGRDKTDERH